MLKFQPSLPPTPQEETLVFEVDAPLVQVLASHLPQTRPPEVPLEEKVQPLAFDVPQLSTD